MNELSTPKPQRVSFSDNWQTGWDAHSLTTFQTCPRKYQLQILEGWTPKERGVHIRFGGGFHKALEIFEKTSGTFIEKMYAAIRAALTDTANADGTTWVSENPYKNIETLLTTVVWYLDDFGENDSLETVFVDGKPALELSFRYDFEISKPIGSVFLCGHFDRVVTFQNNYWIVDRKTTKYQIGSNYFESFNPHTQFTHYTYASQVVLPEPAKGVIVDAAQILVSGTRFARGFSMRTDTDIREYEHELKITLSIAKQFADRDFYPKNPSSCSNYGGCEFRQICSASDFMRENLLKTHFAKNWWDPLVSRED